MTNKKVSGKARGAKTDPAEAWLVANDPEYAEQKKGWTAPTTDVLSRIHSELNAPHPTLSNCEAIISRSGEPTGNYRCRKSGAKQEPTGADPLCEITALEDDYDEDSRP